MDSKEVLITLVNDIHYGLHRTKIFAIHTHRPFYDARGKRCFSNMGEDNQLCKDRLNKLIADCGKMKDYVNNHRKGLGQEILANEKTLQILHNIEKVKKHLKKDSRKKNLNPNYSIGPIDLSYLAGAKQGDYAGIIDFPGKEKASFWDIKGQAYVCIVMDADVNEEGKFYKKLVTLIKEFLSTWETKLKIHNIEIPSYKELDPIKEAAEYGQHAALFVETAEDAYKKASVLTSEKRFQEAAVLYNYALTKCESDDQRAKYYGCMGLSYEDAKELTLAGASYLTALKYNPNMQGLHLNLGNVYREMGNKEGAEFEYEAELSLAEGDHMNARKNLSLLLKAS